MYDKNGDPRYPLDEWLGIRKRQKYSPLVEVKVAELASKSDYRESARILKEWTVVDLSHTTVGRIVRRVGERSEEHTSELQSRGHLVCRLLLEKKKKKARKSAIHI